MSAFITSDENINSIISFIRSDSGKNQHIYRSLENTNLTWSGQDDARVLGSKMRDLNIEAVCARYTDDKVEVLRGNDDYKFVETLRPSRIQAYKSLRCWLYQCTEGHIPETDLFKAFDQVSSEMAKHIVNRLPEFDAATWG